MGLIQQFVLFVVTLYIAMWFFNTESRYNAEFLRGKQVVITGASSGVGEQLAYHYAKMGAKLLLAARRETLLAKVAKKCQSLGAKTVEINVGDLTLEEAQWNLTKTANRVFGGKVDQLLLSHGVYGANRWAGNEDDLTRLKNTMSTNFISHIDVVSKLLPHLIQCNGGIGVVSGLTGIVPMPLLSDLSASQAAQQRFFSALRQELMETKGVNVTVTTVILGMVSTDRSSPIYEKWFPWLNRWFSTSAEGAAEAIAKGVTNQVDQVFYPFRAHLQRYFYDLYQEVYEYNFHFVSF